MMFPDENQTPKQPPMTEELTLEALQIEVHQFLFDLRSALTDPGVMGIPAGAMFGADVAIKLADDMKALHDKVCTPATRAAAVKASPELSFLMALTGMTAEQLIASAEETPEADTTETPDIDLNNLLG